MQKTVLFLCVFPLLLTLGLFSAGCAIKKPLTPQERAPKLSDDPAFLADLRQTRPQGPGGIAVVAPSSGPADNGASAHALADKLGVRFPQSAVDNRQVPYNATSDQARLRLLADALTDPAVEVIWALRGGYGSSRLLSGLSRLALPRSTKKILIGYSDITFLHLFFQKKGWKTVHASLFGELDSQSKDEDNFRRLAALLAGRVKELRYAEIHPYNQAALALTRPVRAVLTGGNLTCIAAAEGTPWPLQASGKILFLEDVKEPGYKIDRMLTQLRLAGSLKGVKAVVLGAFTTGDEFTEHALKRFASDCGIPVFKTEQFGHGPQNFPLIFNALATLQQNPDDKGAFILRIRADQLP